MVGTPDLAQYVEFVLGALVIRHDGGNTLANGLSDLREVKPEANHDRATTAGQITWYWQCHGTSVDLTAEIKARYKIIMV